MVLLGIILIGFSLRTGVVSFPPLVLHISADIPLESIVVGVIGSIPLFVFAGCGIIAPPIAARLGLDRAILLAVVLMVAGLAVRSLAPGVVVIIVGTVITLLGAGLANVYLPPAVKSHFPDWIGGVTTAYVALSAVGAMAATVVAVPVADAIDWRASMGVWAVIAAIALIPWIAAARNQGARDPRLAEPDPMRVAHLLRSPIAWSMVGMFGVSALVSYSIFAWFPVLLVEHSGVEPAVAGVLMGVFAAGAIPCSLLVPRLVVRFEQHQPRFVLVGALCFLAGVTGLLVSPRIPLLWMIIAGFGMTIFSLTLTLISLRARTRDGVVALSAFVQGTGYVLAGAGPLAVGVLRDVSGGWTGPLVFLIAVHVACIPAIWILRRREHVEDESTSRRR